MIFKTIPNRGNEEEKKETHKRRVLTNDAVSVSNSVANAEYPIHPSSEFNV